MKKNFPEKKNAHVKVAKLRTSSIENGIVVFVGVLLFTNLLISLKILFS